MLAKREIDSTDRDAAIRQMRWVAGLVLWGSVGLQTFELISKHLWSRHTVVNCVMLIALATTMILPTRWPRKVKVPVALLGILAAGYDTYLTRIPVTSLWCALLSVTLPIAILLGLRRWTTWRWIKGPWASLGLLTVGTAIGLGLAVRFGA